VIRTLVAFAMLALPPGAVARALQQPVVLMDSAHHNIISPNHASVVDFLERSGYRVRELRTPFDAVVLQDVRIVVIRGALSARNALPEGFTQEEFDRAWSRPTPSAFSGEEIRALHDWVSAGGGLLIVFDHMPLPGAVEDLAAAFGIEVSNGYAADSLALTGTTAESVVRAAEVVFRRSEGTLEDDPITSGAGPAERVDSVATWVGSAFRMPRAGRSLLTLGPSFVSILPDTAWVFTDSTPRERIGGWSQGAALDVGEGRVAVFSELGILVSPEMVAENEGEGPNPQVQNPRLLLNVLAWLAGGLGN